jgi:hypothetical protein
MGRVRDCAGRAPQRRFLEGLYCASPAGLAGAGCGPDQVVLGQLTRRAMGQWPSQPAGDLSPDPKGGHPPPDPPGQATLRGPEQRVSEPEDSERLRAGGPSGRDAYPAA